MLNEHIEPTELNLGINLIREYKRYKLPVICGDVNVVDGSTVELYILGISSYRIDSLERPMRFGKIFGNRIFINSYTDQHNINPKFVYDAENKVWVMMNVGYIIFSEMEIECQNIHKVYGEIDA